MSQKVMIHQKTALVFHWLVAFGFTVLLLTGLYLHNPVVSAPYVNMTSAQYLQFITGFITAGIVTLRVYYTIVTGDYKNVLFVPADVKELIGLLKYYFFLENKKPPQKKYNAGQKLIFTSWFIFFIFQFYTGILLYFPALTNNYSFFGLLQNIRFYHYLVALWFLATLPVHIYLALTGDPGRLQAIFTGWARIAKPKKS